MPNEEMVQRATDWLRTPSPDDELRQDITAVLAHHDFAENSLAVWLATFAEHATPVAATAGQ